MPRFLLETSWGLLILTGTDPILFIHTGTDPILLMHTETDSLYTIRDRPLFYLRGQTPFIFANQVMAEPISPANQYGDRPLNFYQAEPNYPGPVRGQTPHFLMEIDFFIADRPPHPYTYRLWRSRKNYCNLYQTK